MRQVEGRYCQDLCRGKWKYGGRGRGESHGESLCRKEINGRGRIWDDSQVGGQKSEEREEEAEERVKAVAEIKEKGEKMSKAREAKAKLEADTVERERSCDEVKDK